MTDGLPIPRLLAVMILAIIAWAGPSAAHAHAGHHRPATMSAQASAITVRPGEADPRLGSSAAIAVSSAVGSATAIRSEGPDRMNCYGPCCCGASCCAPGILASPVSLPEPAADRAVLRPRDAQARAGLGPESLSEPPRPLA